MKKLLEFKNQDFMKGISAYFNTTFGGLFQLLTNVNPFEEAGVALPSLTPANATTGISTTPRTLEGFQTSGVAYVYVHTDTKVYKVLVNSPYTATDVTSSFFSSFGFGTILKQLGKVTWKGKYIYASKTSTGNTYINSNVFPGGSDTQIRDPAIGTGYDYVTFCVGADNNCYHNYQIGQFNELTSTTTTAGNSNIFKIDDGFHWRCGVNDGRYLVIVADNNAAAIADRIPGAFKVRVYFWDMVQTDANSYITPDIMWEFDDDFAIGARMLGDGIELITNRGIFLTSVGTRPRPIRPFPTTATGKMGKPLNPYQIAGDAGSIYWVDGSHNLFNDVHAYGNPLGGQKIFYTPYTQTTGVLLYTCLTVSGSQIIAGTDQPGLFIFNVGTTRGTLQLTTVSEILEQPHTYGYTKVVLKEKLSFGQSVQCVATTNNGSATVASETKSYNASKPKQTLLFRRKPSGSDQAARVEDLGITISSNAGIKRITSYGEPLEDGNEDL